MKIYIKTVTGKKIELDVEPNESIEDVKMKIQHKEGYAPDQQILTWNSRNLEDGKTLEFYNIENKETLLVQLKKRGCNLMTIYVNIDGQKHKMGICICGNVKHIKEQINEKIGIKPEFQELSFNGKILDDEKVRTKDLGLNSFSIINLKLKGSGNVDYKTLYENELEQLKNMGFIDENENLEALKLNDGNIQYAVELLINRYN